jgi:RNA polymerase sigma-70 factor (ECF subfamily)
MPIILRYIEGYSVNEIAKLLRVPSGTVKSRLFKRKKKVEKIIG